MSRARAVSSAPDALVTLEPLEERLVGAIALEETLGRSVLARLGGPTGAALDAFLARAVDAGLLLADRAPPAVLFAAAVAEEPWYRVHPDREQLALRALGRQGRLRELVQVLTGLLGARSVSELVLALQEGDLARFARAFGVARLPRHAPPRTAAAWLRASVCAPFDAEWLREVYGDAAIQVVGRVLRECLDDGAACDAALAWARSHLPEAGDARAELQSTLRQHAIFRGEEAPGEPAGLPRETALGLEAAAAFAAGDGAGAGRAVTALLSADGPRRGRPAATCGAVTPIVALLLAARDDAAARALARRLIGAGTSDPERATARAFRTLLKYLEQAEGTHRRLDAYQLDATAGVWELLLSAHTVQLHLEQPATRAAWAVLVARRAAEWHAAGHAFLAWQAVLLARELHAEHADRALAERGATPSAWVTPRPALSLWDLLSPKPEWRRALEALAGVAEEPATRDAVEHRAAWFVDGATGALVRPALQEYRVDAGGWTPGRRLSLPELFELRHTLPPEDARVLECTRETADGKRDFTPEAYEALIGHPRVRDGARGGAAVEVTRGCCRVETVEEAGYVRVVVEPEGAALGVNVVPEGEDRLVVYRVTRAMRRVMDVLPHGVRVPRAHEPELVEVLGRLSRSVEVRSAALGAERLVPADATPCLRVSPYAGAWLVQIGVRPFGAAGRFFVAGEGRVSVTHAEAGARTRTERNLELERARVAALVAECPSLDPARQGEPGDAPRADEAHSFTFGEGGLLGLLSELRRATVRHELEWPASPPVRLTGHATSRALHARLRSKKGWYLVTGGVRLDAVTEVALEELVQAPYVASGRFVRLPTGDYVELEERVRRVVQALAAAGNRRRRGAELRVHPGAISVLEELARPEHGLDVEAETRAWLSRVGAQAASEFPPPAELRAELRPYQLAGYVWLRRLSELGLGACLADDMGLGKTVQIIAHLVARAAHGPALVVAPTSVCANWVRELRRFAPTLSPVEYTGKARATLLGGARAAGTVVVASYALLQQDEAALTGVPWGTAVLDEAQFIKNARSLRAQAAFKLVAGHRVAATGTPVENHFGDLFSIFQFLNPGLLGEWADFNRLYLETVERGGLEEPEAALRQIVRPYILRRAKRDVLTELPPLTEVQHDVRLSRDEALRYALLRRQVHDKLFTPHGKRENKLQVLAELTRLRRFCCHPRLAFPDADVESSKVRAFLDLVTELRECGRRALVFSQYVDFLEIVREPLDELGIAYEYLDGSTPAAARQASVDAFQDGSATLFLISLKAGGFGLNLTGADTVIHLDPWWNPAVEAQATDRAHRIGQSRPVTVYRLVTRDTIEERIVELHEQKQRLARALLEGTEQVSELSGEELLRLVSGEEPPLAAEE